MGRADGINAHFTQDTDLPIQRNRIAYCAQSTLVMVHAHAVQLHVLTVEKEALLRVKGEPAKAEFRIIGIDCLTIGQNIGMNHIESAHTGSP